VGQEERRKLGEGGNIRACLLKIHVRMTLFFLPLQNKRWLFLSLQCVSGVSRWVGQGQPWPLTRLGLEAVPGEPPDAVSTPSPSLPWVRIKTEEITDTQISRCLFRFRFPLEAEVLVDPCMPSVTKGNWLIKTGESHSSIRFFFFSLTCCWCSSKKNSLSLDLAQKAAGQSVW